MKKILIIEDEPSIRELVNYNLKVNGYEVLEAGDGNVGMDMVYSEKPDLILLDIMLPGKDGFEICRELRNAGIKTPIIMLTAKNEETDKVRGLDFGADDYISKPFGIREMMARIKAVLRRYDVANIPGTSPETETNSHTITVGDLVIDPDRYVVTEGGKEIEFTLKEFELLRFLAENRGHVFTRDEILDKVWGIDYVGETRTVDVHIRHLRKKLSQGDEDKYIETIRGKGYKIK